MDIFLISAMDIFILFYLLISIIFCFSGYDITNNSLLDSGQAGIKGLVVGAISYSIIFFLGLIIRVVIKQNYSPSTGTGLWMLVYYITCLSLLSTSTIIWIFTTAKSFKAAFPEFINGWTICNCVAFVFALSLAIFVWIISWLVQLLFPGSRDMSENQYMGPDEQHPNRYQQQPKTQLMPPNQNMNQPMNQQNWHNTSPMQFASPYQTQYIPHTPVMMSPMMNSPNFRTLQTSYNTNYADQHPPNQTYNQQAAAKVTGKKIGSNESTGSTYYQQLMKTRGGVKSISQYGELLKQKKPPTIKQTRKVD